MALNSNFRTLTADNIEGIVEDRNYLKSSFENGTITGWREMAVTVDANGFPNATPTIGTDASPNAASSLSLSATSTTPLSGARSLLVTVPTSLSQGQGFISEEFTLDRMDLGKVLTVSFDYERISGTYNFSGTRGSQTWMVYIYDATAGGATWIQPAGFLGMNQSSGPGRVACTFQTSVTAGQKYRVAVIASQAAAGASSIEFDNFTCSRQTAPIGPVVTDWVSYTPTGNWTTNTTYSGRYRRVGDTMEIQFLVSLSGAPNAAGLSINLPSGFTADTSKIAASSLPDVLGSAQALKSGNGYLFGMYLANATSIQVSYISNGSTSIESNVTNTAPVTWASGDTINGSFRVPIIGWSSQVQLSNDTDTRVVDFKTVQATNQSIPNGTPTKVNFGSTIFDTHAGWSAGSSWYVIPVSGYYDVKSRVSFAINGTGVRYTALYKNAGVFLAVSPILNANIVTADYVTSSMSEEFYFNAGDYIYVEAVQTSGGALAVSNGNSSTENRTALNITRRSGPSVVAASESVSGRFYKTAVQSFSSQTKLVGYTTIFDSHAAWDSANSRYRIPVSGKYMIITQVQGSGGTSIGQLTGYSINGGGVFFVGTYVVGTNFDRYGGSDVFTANAGDYIELYHYTTGAVNVQPGELSTRFEIVRVGN